eukprot:15865283-Heterocapsa_arctica.AAC.1
MGSSCPPLPRGPVPVVAWSLCPLRCCPFPWTGISETSCTFSLGSATALSLANLSPSRLPWSPLPLGRP